MTLRNVKAILIGVSLLSVAACNRQVSSSLDHSDFGAASANNLAAETGQLGYEIDLSRRFASEVPNTVNFAFDSAYLDGGAQQILKKQASWIKRFPEVRFRVYGYTDEVGGEHYNYGLGLRRAQAVVSFLVSEGISRSRLQAVVSYGKTRPLIDVPTQERQNRRAITDVAGFVRNAPLVLDGRYGEIIYRSYVESATPSSSLLDGTSASTTSTTGTGGSAPTPTK